MLRPTIPHARASGWAKKLDMISSSWLYISNLSCEQIDLKSDKHNYKFKAWKVVLLNLNLDKIILIREVYRLLTLRNTNKLTGSLTSLKVLRGRVNKQTAYGNWSWCHTNWEWACQYCSIRNHPKYRTKFHAPFKKTGCRGAYMLSLPWHGVCRKKRHSLV